MTQRSRTQTATSPYWNESAAPPTCPRLERDLRVDVVVVGGGITGLTTAYLLSSAGKSVALVERRRCGHGDTEYTTAHLTMVTDERLSDLVEHFGRDHAQAAWDAGLAAISQIHSIILEHDIDCSFGWVDGYLHAPFGPDVSPTGDFFEQEAALARELGFDADFVREAPVVHKPGIRFPGQARFHPRQYLAGLMQAIGEAGGQIYEQSPVQEFLSDQVGAKVNGHIVSCEDIVLATHNPLSGIAGFLSSSVFQTKLALYNSYVVAGRIAKNRVPDALFWDTLDPYHYLRIQPEADHDLIIFGGEDHKTGQADDTTTCFERLEKTLKAVLPDIDVTRRWSGQVIETPDGLPYIGRTADHQYVATGFAGNGMTFGTLSAMMTRDRLLGASNPWTDLFEPDRKAIARGAWEYLKENADYPYYLIRDRFAGAEGRSVRAVKRGQGEVIEQDGRKLAVYRNEKGEATVLSASCTHMGCIVDWNEAEQTWDCPCHGSRFKPTGDVIGGPAESPLEPAM
jgi:glycine/D-amino acid oxidase-like deaminating enzyme/nitrite reductase/ring-hydroxylating ferredoxin subunit